MSDLKFTFSDVTSFLPENMCGLLKKLTSGLLESSFLFCSSSFLLLLKTVADSRHFMLSGKSFIVPGLNSGKISFLVLHVKKKVIFFVVRIILSKFS